MARPHPIAATAAVMLMGILVNGCRSSVPSERRHVVQADPVQSVTITSVRYGHRPSKRTTPAKRTPQPPRPSDPLVTLQDATTRTVKNNDEAPSRTPESTRPPIVAADFVVESAATRGSAVDLSVESGRGSISVGTVSSDGVQGTQLAGLFEPEGPVDPMTFDGEPATDRDEMSSSDDYNPPALPPAPSLPTRSDDEPSADSSADSSGSEGTQDGGSPTPLPQPSSEDPVMQPMPGESGVPVSESAALHRSIAATAAVRAATLEAQAVRAIAAETRCKRETLLLTSRVMLYRRAQRGLESAKAAGELYRRCYHGRRGVALAHDLTLLLAEEREAARDAFEKGVASEDPIMRLDSKIAESQRAAREAEAALAAARSQLAALIGLPPGASAETIEPLLDHSELASYTPDQVAMLAVTQRPEPNLLRAVLTNLNERNLQVARAVVSGIDPALGLDTNECILLAIILRNDGRAKEVCLRGRQLRLALAEAERAVAAEARAASQRAYGAKLELDVAREIVGFRQAELDNLNEQRDIDLDVTDGDILAARLAVLTARRTVADAEQRLDIVLANLDAAIAAPVYRIGMLRR